MSASSKKVLIRRLALAGLIALASASPAFAQAAGVGGGIGSFIQQLVDLNTRERPTADRHNIPVLVVLDELARLGHAVVIAVEPTGSQSTPPSVRSHMDG